MVKLKESTHERIAPAPQQKRLPAARRTVRSGAARPSLLALKKQSTLTQLDFVDAPNSSRATISDSEVTEGDDEEFEDPRPKKKRKSKDVQRARDQSSLTQKWNRPGWPKIERGSDDEGHRWSNPRVIREFNGGDTRDTQAIAMDLREVVEETPPSSLRVPESEPSSSVRSIVKAAITYVSTPGLETTRPTTADSALNFTTPRNTFRTIIPSSNTPSSVQLSVHRSRARSEYTSSPLKERSCNRRTAEVSQGYVTARESPSPLKRPCMPSVARQLNRINTIHDSQSDDSDIEEIPGPALLPPTTTSLNVEPRTLKRTITVQDSDGDLDLEDIDGDNDGDDDSTVVEDEEDQQNTVVEDELDQRNVTVEDEVDQENIYSASTYPQTFDPVSAAMDRDAARFGNGPTQMETQYVSFYDQEDENDETLVNDEVEFVAESPIAEVIGEPSQDLGDDSEKASERRDETHPAGLSSNVSLEITEPTSATKNDEQATELPVSSTAGQSAPPIANEFDQQTAELQLGDDNEENIQQSLPSPQQPRPSQMSTVVPTQWTSDRRNSGQESAPISPPKSGPWGANTLSSSPFPMPPWTFSNPDDDDHGARLGPQYDSMLDFSLPPPPPMHSSMRQSSSTGLE